MNECAAKTSALYKYIKHIKGQFGSLMGLELGFGFLSFEENICKKEKKKKERYNLLI